MYCIKMQLIKTEIILQNSGAAGILKQIKDLKNIIICNELKYTYLNQLQNFSIKIKTRNSKKKHRIILKRIIDQLRRKIVNLKDRDTRLPYTN